MVSEPLEHRAAIMHAIEQDHLLSQGGCSQVYCVGDDLVAKVFTDYFSRDQAELEFSNLFFLNGLDRRVRVPSPVQALNLGEREDLADLGLRETASHFSYPIFAVLMERILGDDLINVSPTEGRSYYKALKSLFDALIQRGIFRWDLKPQDIICMEDSEEVCLLDTHSLRMLEVTEEVTGKYQEMLGYLER